MPPRKAVKNNEVEGPAFLFEVVKGLLSCFLLFWLIFLCRLIITKSFTISAISTLRLFHFGDRIIIRVEQRIKSIIHVVCCTTDSDGPCTRLNIWWTLRLLSASTSLNLTKNLCVRVYSWSHWSCRKHNIFTVPWWLHNITLINDSGYCKTCTSPQHFDRT